MSLQFEQIELEPAYRKVAAALRARILDQTLREGDRLPAEMELARQFGVNRSTVREALRELQTRGLLSRRRGSKCFAVTRPAPRMVAEGVSHALALHGVSYFDVWEGLSILEPPIAEAAARRRNAADLREIEVVVERYAADHVLAERAVHHAVEFFRVVGAATHNRVLLLAQAPLLQLLEPSLCAMIDRLPQARTRIRTAQRRICEALNAADPVEARTWMARHIRDFRRGYELAGIALDSPCPGPLEPASASGTSLA